MKDKITQILEWSNNEPHSACMLSMIFKRPREELEMILDEMVDSGELKKKPPIHKNGVSVYSLNKE